jgi:hypothetical protein
MQTQHSVSFSLNTTFFHLANLIELYAQQPAGDHPPLQCKRAVREVSHSLDLTVHGASSATISFQTVSLSAGCIGVEATCLDPQHQPLFDSFMAHIGTFWPAIHDRRITLDQETLAALGDLAVRLGTDDYTQLVHAAVQDLHAALGA